MKIMKNHSFFTREWSVFLGRITSYSFYFFFPSNSTSNSQPSHVLLTVEELIQQYLSTVLHVKRRTR